MTNLRDLLADAEAPDLDRRRRTIPKGWDPGIAFKGDGTGVATLHVEDRDTSFDQLLSQRFPTVPVEVLEVLELRSWDSGGEPQMYVKVKVARRPDHIVAPEDVAALIKQAARWKAKTPKADRTAAPGAMHVCLGDWQLGKDHEVGGGPAETLARIDGQLTELLAHCKGLRKLGQLPADLVLWSMGDLIEQCSGNYPSQPFTVTLTMRDQLKLARRLLLKWVRELAPLFDAVTLTGVASNHGEVRQNGKAITTPADSYDLMLLENTAEVLANIEACANVTVLLPPDPLVAQLEVGGVRVAAIHGHKATRGATAAQKMWNWWQGQTFGSLLDVDVLFAGHYHHTYLVDQQGKALFGTPANDGGSGWLTDTSGIHSAPGTLTVVLDPTGWRNLHVLRGA